MTQEEKELVLKDLCARLPYGVFVEDKIVGKDFDENGNVFYTPVIYTYDYHPNIKKCKHYLRPMSSMTEEEEKYYDVFCLEPYMGIDEETASNFIDWLNKNMFDYRGLIEKGLALEAPEGMYEIK